MIVRNFTRKKLLSNKAKFAKNIKDKTFGLIFDKGRGALVTTTRFGIHTHLMKKPIDILILDKNKRVVKLKEKLLPNKIFLWNPKYNTIVELPGGTISKSGTKLGDKIEFKE